MPDSTPSTPEDETARAAALAPETFNDEQDDEDAQAHTLADEALGRLPGDWGSPTESIKVNRGNFDEDSTQDLVDHMRDMERSGRIDMGAYRGEENMDDEEDKYGDAARLDDDPTFQGR
jgi:hypothetical protein